MPDSEMQSEGGKARAKKLTGEERAAIAKNAAGGQMGEGREGTAQSHA